jgi:hypothetical protein
MAGLARESTREQLAYYAWNFRVQQAATSSLSVTHRTFAQIFVYLIASVYVRLKLRISTLPLHGCTTSKFRLSHISLGTRVRISNCDVQDIYFSFIRSQSQLRCCQIWLCFDTSRGSAHSRRKDDEGRDGWNGTFQRLWPMRPQHRLPVKGPLRFHDFLKQQTREQDVSGNLHVHTEPPWWSTKSSRPGWFGHRRHGCGTKSSRSIHKTQRARRCTSTSSEGEITSRQRRDGCCG